MGERPLVNMQQRRVRVRLPQEPLMLPHPRLIADIDVEQLRHINGIERVLTLTKFATHFHPGLLSNNAIDLVLA